MKGSNLPFIVIFDKHANIAGRPERWPDIRDGTLKNIGGRRRRYSRSAPPWVPAVRYWSNAAFQPRHPAIGGRCGKWSFLTVAGAVAGPRRLSTCPRHAAGSKISTTVRLQTTDSRFLCCTPISRALRCQTKQGAPPEPRRTRRRKGWRQWRRHRSRRLSTHWKTSDLADCKSVSR